MVMHSVLLQVVLGIATLLAVVEAEIASVRVGREELPRDWDAFFAVALQRDPSRRFADAAAFRDALRPLAEADGPIETMDIGALLPPDEDDLPELPLESTAEILDAATSDGD